MQFGVCGDPGMAAAAREAAFDYAEWTVGAALKPRAPRQAFEAALASVRSAALPYRVLNCFVPGDLKITGPDADVRALKDYVSVAFERAEEAGVEVIVFGSGGARRIPEGFDRNEARGQLLRFCSMLAPLAQSHGVTVVIEPLNRGECNVLNTVGECAEMVREVGHPAVRLLVDAYHLLRDHDSCDDVVANADLLRHAHIATPANRLAPGAEPCDFAPFFSALAAAGYSGGISIEAKITNPARDLAAALSHMRGLASRQRQSGPA